MKRFAGRISLGVSVLALFAVWAATSRSFSQSTSPQGSVIRLADGRELRLAGPFTHKNLTVYLVCGENVLKASGLLTLDEALAQKKAVVNETGSVGELSVENLSETEAVFIQAGDVVKGGRQDRTVQSDMIVVPKTGAVPLKSFCVEHGRWSGRGDEKATVFEASKNAVNSKDLKLAVRAEGEQQEVWAKVAEVQEKMSTSVGTTVKSDVSPSSLQLTMESGKVQAYTEEYLSAIENAGRDQAQAIGFVACVNGEVRSADIYGSDLVFRKLWAKMLTASVQEAVADLGADGSSAPVPTGQQVAAFLEQADKDGRESAEKRKVNASTEERKQEAADAFVFESFDLTAPEGGQSLRKSYVKK